MIGSKGCPYNKSLFHAFLVLALLLAGPLNARPVDPDDAWKVHVSANGHFPGAPGIRVLWWWNTGAPDWTRTEVIRCDSFSPDPAAAASEPSQCARIATEHQEKGGDYSGTYYDTSVEDGKYYWYKVKVCDASSCAESRRSSYDLGNGESSHISGAWIGAEPIAPQSPTGVTVEKISDYAVKITWVGNDPRMTDFFQFYRCANASVGSCEHIRTYDDYRGKYFDIDFNAISYYYGSSANPGPSYYYRLKACAQGFEKDESSIVCSPLSNYGYQGGGTPRLPDPPKGLSASDGAFDDRIRVTWSASESATSYRLHRDGSFLSETTGTAYVDIDGAGNELMPLTQYRYAAMACNAAGCSGMSNHDLGHVKEDETSAGSGYVIENTGRGEVLINGQALLQNGTAEIVQCLTRAAGTRSFAYSTSTQDDCVTEVIMKKKAAAGISLECIDGLVNVMDIVVFDGEDMFCGDGVCVERAPLLSLFVLAALAEDKSLCHQARSFTAAEVVHDGFAYSTAASTVGNDHLSFHLTSGPGRFQGTHSDLKMSIQTDTAKVQSASQNDFVVYFDPRTDTTVAGCIEGAVKVAPANDSLKDVTIRAGQKVVVTSDRIGPVTDFYWVPPASRILPAVQFLLSGDQEN